MAAAVLTVSVVVPLPITEGGLNEGVAPPGRPVTLKLTAPLKQPLAPMLSPKVMLVPGSTLCALVIAERVKPGLPGALTGVTETLSNVTAVT